MTVPVELQVGQPVPDFCLKDEHGQQVRLSDVRAEKNVAVVFYPFAFSRICLGELGEIRDNLEVFENDDVQVLAVSCDSVFGLRAWSELEKFRFPLLSDFWPHGAVTRQYGVFNEITGTPLRGSFLIDASGILRWSVVNRLGEARPLAGYREAIAAL